MVIYSLATKQKNLVANVFSIILAHLYYVPIAKSPQGEDKMDTYSTVRLYLQYSQKCDGKNVGNSQPKFTKPSNSNEYVGAESMLGLS